MAHAKPGKKTKPLSKDNSARTAAPAVAGRPAIQASPETRPQKRLLVTAVCAGLVVACIAIYGQTITHAFVNYDDNMYVMENMNVQAGLTLKSIEYAFVTEKALYFHPLTWMSLMLDHDLYGMHAGGYHITNLILHTASSVLLFLALRLLTGAFWPSAAVAALFAVHPLNVESVAWVAERKGVLSAFFWMLALGAYGRYVRRGGALRYAAVAVAFLGGLMSKPMMLTLPCALLLLDCWPLDRVTLAEPLAVTAKKATRLAVEKIPLFLLTALSALSTFVMQSRGHNIDVAGKVSLATRCANAMVIYVLYLLQTLWPSGLAAFYPYPDTRPLWQVGGAALVLATVTLFALSQMRRRPYLIVGWLWYLGTLAPVIGLVRIGDFSHADRYTYIPSLGLYFMAAWGVADLATAWKLPKSVVAAASGAALAALALCAGVQTSHWKNDWTLFSHAVDVGQESCVAYTNMGMAAKDQGRRDDAEKYLKRALELNPKYIAAINHLALLAMDEERREDAAAYLKQALELDSAEPNALNNLGLLDMELGHYDEARECLNKVLQVRPDDINALNNLGKLSMDEGRNDEAMTLLKQALGLKPDHVNAHINLGILAMKQKRYEESKAYLMEAQRLDPENAGILSNLSALAEAQGLHDEAKAYLVKAQEKKPDNVGALYNLGKFVLDQGHQDEAKTYLKKALELDPKYVNALNGLGMIAMNQGQPAEARTWLARALEQEPKNTEVLYNLGVVARSEKNFDEARTYFMKTLELEPGNVKALNNLGVTAMEQGRNDEAVTYLKKALELKPDHVNALTNLGKLEMDQKHYDEAKTYLKKALELDPKSLPALHNLGLCLLNQEQFEEAQASFRKALEIDPQYVRSMKALSAALAKLGRQEESDTYSKKAAELEQARAGK